MNQTQDLVKRTFQSDFDRQQFSKFIDRLLKNADFSKKFPQSGGNIRQAFRDKVSSFERIAQFTDVDGNKIDILIVNLKQDSTVERARTSLRNFAADYLQSDRGLGKAAVLVAYVSESKRDWRFSYVTLETSLVKTESGKFKEAIKRLTPARRFSFLVGSIEQKSHTAQKQFFNLLQSQSQPTLKQIEDAFSIERVTKEFYAEYEKLFKRLESEIETLRRKDSALSKHLKENFIESADFAKKLLGQIVFLYFLQKKGWFGVERGAAWGSGNKNFLRYLFEHRAKLGTRQERGARESVNFFNDILEHLFYDALARERDEDYYARFDCKIPFLNGGLFEAAYSWSSTDVLLPDALFSNTETTKEGDEGTGILDVFDRYNFTVNEAEPLEKDVAVDPEMLGKVFENLLPENERKGKGSYYTPRPIVNYMCQQSLVSYLATHLKDVPREDIETFIRIGDFQSDYDAAGTKAHEENFLPESISSNAPKIDELLEDIRVCDPAIGSGAFPVGMMQEIVRARASLTNRLDLAKPNKTPSERESFARSRTAYELKRHAIQTSLYGVDIDPGAVEIAKLRLWLSLVVDEDERERVQALPNLDYKIMQGNALLDEFAGVKLIDDAMFEKPVSDIEAERHAIQGRINELTQQLFALHGKGAEAGELKRKFSKETDRLKKQSKALTQPKVVEELSLLPDDPFAEARATLDEMRRKIDGFFSLTSPREKREMRTRIEKLEWRFMEQTLKARGEEDALKELAVHRRDNRKPYFLWKLYFSDVFRSKGGFDVAIANPPYGANIDSNDLSVYVQSYPRSTSGIRDLYKMFIEKGMRDLCRQEGLLCYITPNTFLTQLKYKDIRQFLLEHKITQIINLGDGVFEQVVVPTSVTLVEKNKKSDALSYSDIPAEYRFVEKILQLPSKIVSQKMFLQTPGNIFVDSYRAKKDDEIALGEIMHCKDAGVQYAAPGVGRLNKGQAKLGERLLYSGNRKEHKDDIALIVGNDISKWHLNLNSTNFLRHNYAELLKKESGEWLHFTESIFDAKQRIIWRQTADRLIATYDTSHKYFKKSVHAAVFILGKEKEFSYFYILALLNSKYVNHRYAEITKEGGRIFAQVKITQVKSLSIKVASSEQQTIIATFVDYILFLKANASDETRETLMTNYFEQIIDALVYELYLTEELHAADKHFFRPLRAEQLPLLKERQGDERKVIQKVFERLSDVNHPVRKNLYFLDNLESVRIIEDK